MRDVSDLIRQTILDEMQGNVAAAFEEACRRLSIEYAHADTLEAEIVQWRKGASLAYLRRKAEPTVGKIDDVPTPIDDAWIATGKEA